MQTKYCITKGNKDNHMMEHGPFNLLIEALECMHGDIIIARNKHQSKELFVFDENTLLWRSNKLIILSMGLCVTLKNHKDISNSMYAQLTELPGVFEVTAHCDPINNRWKCIVYSDTHGKITTLPITTTYEHNPKKQEKMVNEGAEGFWIIKRDDARNPKSKEKVIGAVMNGFFEKFT